MLTNLKQKISIVSNRNKNRLAIHFFPEMLTPVGKTISILMLYREHHHFIGKLLQYRAKAIKEAMLSKADQEIECTDIIQSTRQA